ncbi:MAG: TolC family protein [Halobacteriovoraceae bacterium]|nr:TolC family protein [Halobacteriovoraceae bacterium]
MKYIFAIGLYSLWGTFTYAEGLSLGQYLEKVKSDNDALNGIEIRVKAFKDIEAEADLLYSAQLNSSINYTNDQRPTTTSSFQGDQTNLGVGSVGVSKNNSYGTRFSVSYNIAKTEIKGASPTLVPQSKFYENYTKLEVSQSLLRNSFGSEYKNKENLIRNNANANRLNQEYRKQVLLSDAENIYYQLLIAEDSFRIQKESYSRAQSIESYTRSRYYQKLGDKTDYLQAKAALKQRELQLQVSKDDKRRITQVFNSYMGINSSTLDRKLIGEEIESLNNLNLDREPNSKLDTLASKFNLETEKAQQKINLESFKPDLQIAGSASLYGRDGSLGRTVKGSLGTNNPVYTIGLNLAMPLGLGTQKKVKSAYQLNVDAAKREYAQKVFNDKNEWLNLKSQYLELQAQLKIFKDLVKLQKVKLNNEILEQKRGKATTFQVLSFEQEYLSTQLQKVQLQSNLAKIYTQLKLFN